MENLDKEILILKGKVIPSNMKPLRPLRSVSSHHTADDVNYLFNHRERKF